MSSRFLSNYEAFASELPENLEEMFPRYDMDSDVIRILKLSTPPYWCVDRCKRDKTIYATAVKVVQHDLMVVKHAIP